MVGPAACAYTCRQPPRRSPSFPFSRTVASAGSCGEVGSEKGWPWLGSNMVTALFVAAVLLLLAHADGIRRDGPMYVVMTDSQGNYPPSDGDVSFDDSVDPFENKFLSPRDVPPDFFCHSCQEVSRKVEKFLTDPSLCDDIDTLSMEICHILRSDLQVKCRKLVELYFREGILFLQIIFLEKNLCNSTGFCPVDNSTSSLSTSSDNEVTSSIQPDSALLGKVERQVNMGLSLPSKINHSPFKMRERKSCDACHVAADQIRKGLEDHEQQIKIIRSLLEACESIQNYVNQCKTLVFQYGPLVLANLRRFLRSNDLCLLIHMCEPPTPPKGRTGYM